MKSLLIKMFGKENLAKIVSKDWILKFVSLILAFILWSFVGGEDRIDKIVMVPIEIINSSHADFNRSRSAAKVSS